MFAGSCWLGRDWSSPGRRATNGEARETPPVPPRASPGNSGVGCGGGSRGWDLWFPLYASPGGASPSQGPSTSMLGRPPLLSLLLLRLLGWGAALPRSQLFLFGGSPGDQELPEGDDETSVPVPLPSPLLFYETHFTQLYVSAQAWSTSGSFLFGPGGIMEDRGWFGVGEKEKSAPSPSSTNVRSIQEGVRERTAQARQRRAPTPAGVFKAKLLCTA